MQPTDTDNKQKKQIKCPECENTFDVEESNLEIGAILECPVCGASLEVVDLDPLTVEPVTTYK